MTVFRPFLGAVLAVWPVVVQAQATPPEVTRLIEALMIDDTFAVMRDEGLKSAGEMAEGMFPGGDDQRWQDKVGLIYDTDVMVGRFTAVFADEMRATPELAQLATDFFGDDRGQRILQLEIDARRALLDPDVEDTAKIAAEAAQEDMDPRFALIEDLVTAADLMEQNVAGALNGNLAFYQGMADGGALPDMDEAMVLEQVWSQEPQVRSDMGEWLYPFLYLAYQPLTDDEMEAYVAFWESEAGQKVNQALFAAFDAAFRPISRDLGRASALMMQGNDI
jgi:hypothetical protein